MCYESIDQELWVEVRYIEASNYRKKVMKSLDGNSKIPSELSRDTDILQNHMSVTLKQLKERDLVECINPEVRKGRLYRLTEKGEMVIDKIDSRNRM